MPMTPAPGFDVPTGPLGMSVPSWILERLLGGGGRPSGGGAVTSVPAGPLASVPTALLQRLFPTPTRAAAPMAPAAAPVAAATGPSPAGRPIPVPFTPPVFEPSPEEEMAAKRPAAEYRAPIRAVRLPSGRVVFTNLEDWQDTAPRGADVPYSTAVNEERQQALDFAHTPSGATLTGVMRAQVRAIEDAKARGQGEEEPGGNVSFMPGTPEIQQRLALERGLGDLAIAQTRQDVQRALMSPAEAAEIANPEVVRTKWLMRFIGPQVQKIQEAVAQEIDTIKRTVADPKEQQRRILEAQAGGEEAVNAIYAVMAAGSRQQIPRTY